LIKLSYDIKIYRNQIKDIINPTDTVVEIGSHVGGTTKEIIKYLNNGKIICLDKSPESEDKLNELKKEFRNLTFIKGDVRRHDILKEVYKITDKCDLLLIDMGGGYHPDTVFKVFYIWSSTLKPKNTLIRNRGLIEFINSTKTDETYISSKGFLESYENEGIPPQIKEFSLWTSKLK